jgi:integrase
MLADGGDPGAKRKAEKHAQTATFAAVADEWLESKRATLTDGTWERDQDQLFKIVGPYLGKRPIAAIEAPDILAVLRKLEKRGVNDTAHRVRCRGVADRKVEGPKRAKPRHHRYPADHPPNTGLWELAMCFAT